jgi:hypothetical protein
MAATFFKILKCALLTTGEAGINNGDTFYSFELKIDRFELKIVVVYYNW